MLHLSSMVLLASQSNFCKISVPQILLLPGCDGMYEKALASLKGYYLCIGKPYFHLFHPLKLERT